MAGADRRAGPGPAPRGRAVRHRGPPRRLPRLPRRGRGPRPGGVAAGARRSRPARPHARAPATARRADRPPDRGGAPRRAPQADPPAAWPGGAAAAAAAAAVAVLAVVDSNRSTPSETVAFRSLPRGTFAKATLAPRPWGSEISVHVYGFRPGTLCQVWLRRSDGKRVPAGSFRYVYDGEGDHAGLSSALAPNDATAIGLEAGSRPLSPPCPRLGAPSVLAEPSRTTERRPSHESQVSPISWAWRSRLWRWPAAAATTTRPPPRRRDRRAPARQAVTLSETDYQLDPSDPTVQPGTVSFKVTNDGSVDHNLEVEGPQGEQELEQDLAPGQSGTLTVDLSQPGSTSLLPGRRPPRPSAWRVRSPSRAARRGRRQRQADGTEAARDCRYHGRAPPAAATVTSGSWLRSWRARPADTMERLSADDTRILRLESDAIAGHTLKLAIVEPARDGQPLTVERVRNRVEARLGRPAPRPAAPGADAAAAGRPGLGGRLGLRRPQSRARRSRGR